MSTLSWRLDTRFIKCLEGRSHEQRDLIFIPIIITIVTNISIMSPPRIQECDAKSWESGSQKDIKKRAVKYSDFSPLEELSEIAFLFPFKLIFECLWRQTILQSWAKVRLTPRGWWYLWDTVRFAKCVSAANDHPGQYYLVQRLPPRVISSQHPSRIQYVLVLR